jgi:hypothetical protein
MQMRTAYTLCVQSLPLKTSQLTTLFKLSSLSRTSEDNVRLTPSSFAAEHQKQKERMRSRIYSTPFFLATALPGEMATLTMREVMTASLQVPAYTATKRSRVAKTPASYSGGTGFKSMPGDRLPRQIFCGFSQSFQGNAGIVP